MKKSELHDWLNLTAAASVLVGLVFVALELRQNNELAQAETVRELWNANNETLKFELQSDLAPLIERGIEDPLSLTDDEIVRLDKYFQLRMQFQLSVALMRSNYSLALGTTEDQAADIVDDFLYGRFARGWFSANEFWLHEWHPELVAAIKRVLAEAPIESEYTWPSEIRSSVKKIVERE